MPSFLQLPPLRLPQVLRRDQEQVPGVPADA